MGCVPIPASTIYGNIYIIVDAGIGTPSQAAEAMEMELLQLWQILELPVLVILL
ncbi:hypothetical protein [Anaerococcus octavius]|uniref:hypothetical protein n=1 Tax=Anaerococcus octavius TaxID=54007 RepID=UPI003CCC4A27